MQKPTRIPGASWVALWVLAASAIDWRLFAAVPFLSYLAGRRRRPDAAAAGGLIGVLVLGATVQVVRGVELYTGLVWIAGVIVFGLFPALVGSFRRLRAELARAGWDRAAHLEREQRIVAEQARLRERARIAQDMHDSLGHELSLIALRAGSLELAGDLADEHRTAASELRAGVTTAAERLSEIIGLLADEERIEDLVARAAASGIPVELHAAVDSGDVAQPQYRVAHRVVKESLTNAAKHAGTAPVEVRLDRRDDELIVIVRNEPAGRPPTATHGGRGLTGLREQVEEAGGVLRTGPRPDGGFQVEARLPARPGPALDATPAAADEFHSSRRGVRRGLILTFAVPSALVVGVVGTLSAVYAHDSLTSRLSPDRFRALPVGALRDDVAAHLPERQAPEHRDETGPPPPAGSACEYYRSAAGFIPAPFDIYRLCFRDGRLVTKDALSPPGADHRRPPPTEKEPQ